MNAWHNDNASNRQLKVLKLFGRHHSERVTKRTASGIIGQIFRAPNNREVWLKYVYLTGDETQDSAELLPFDSAELANVVVPDDWRPRGSKIKGKTGIARERSLEMVTAILKEGVPFDDPVPEIEYLGRNFCCTGKFLLGSRAECEAIITSKGGRSQKSLTLETDYLIVGGKLSPSWAHETYGRKIENALMNKLDGRPVALVAEEDWMSTI